VCTYKHPPHHTIIACKPTAFHLPLRFMRRSAYGRRLVGQDALGEMKLFTRTHRQSPIATALSRKGAHPPETPHTHTTHTLSLLNFVTPSLGRISPPSTFRHKTHRPGKTQQSGFWLRSFPSHSPFFAFRFSDQDQLTCHSFHVASVVQSLSCPAFSLFVTCLYTHPVGNNTSSSRHERIALTRRIIRLNHGSRLSSYAFAYSSSHHGIASLSIIDGYPSSHQETPSSGNNGTQCPARNIPPSPLRQSPSGQ
jgi:hypothetical protein